MDAARLRKTLYNVKLYSPNFQGYAKERNAQGDRNFFAVIPIALAAEMIAEGWPVKLIDVKNETSIFILKVTVKSDSVSGKVITKMTLNDEPLGDLSILDTDPSITCTIDIIGQPWSFKPSNEPQLSGIKTYLISLDAKTTPPVMKYHMTASRETSGLEGEYASLEEASDRLSAYGKSFPDEVIEVHITKINP